MAIFRAIHCHSEIRLRNHLCSHHPRWGATLRDRSCYWCQNPVDVHGGVTATHRSFYCHTRHCGWTWYVSTFELPRTATTVRCGALPAAHEELWVRYVAPPHGIAWSQHAHSKRFLSGVSLAHNDVVSLPLLLRCAVRGCLAFAVPHHPLHQTLSLPFSLARWRKSFKMK